MVCVNLKERSYQIIVGKNILSSLGRRCGALKLGSDVFCVTNAFIRSRYGKIIDDSLARQGIGCRFFIVPDGERSKSFAQCKRLLGALAGFDSGRRVFIAAVGGGVIGDLAGFCAAVYKRGIPCVQVPTTLLAQVDSAIGGKTAIDLPEGKNLVGAFYQPRLVVSDISLLATLDRRQFASGMAEALKYGIISDPRLFSLIEDKAGFLGPDDAGTLRVIVEACSRIKAKIVERDERDENGARMILNFGHTIGHAVEAAQGYGGYTHGEAIALGMLCACDISRKLRMLDEKSACRIERVITGLGLPSKISGVNPAAIAGPYSRDKKFKGQSRLVLLAGIGIPRIVEGVPFALVKEVVRKRIA
jgi:3-dehydroquinate synthase